MTWIKTIGIDEAEDALAELYRRVAGPDGQVDRILEAHSLRPHTLSGHMALYKSVLHHSANRLPKFMLEALGVHVSLLNGCEYCVVHHTEGIRRLFDDERQANSIIAALRSGHPEEAFDPAQCALLGYVEKLTTTPAAVDIGDVEALRELGFDDGEILEANQVTAYFAYANRTVLGLGVTTEGERLGHSPSSSAGEDWSHR